MSPGRQSHRGIVAVKLPRALQCWLPRSGSHFLAVTSSRRPGSHSRCQQQHPGWYLSAVAVVVPSPKVGRTFCFLWLSCVHAGSQMSWCYGWGHWCSTSSSCWLSPVSAHEKKSKLLLSNRKTSVAYMGFPMVFGDRSTSVSSQIWTELQLGVEWFG